MIVRRWEIRDWHLPSGKFSVVGRHLTWPTMRFLMRWTVPFLRYRPEFQLAVLDRRTGQHYRIEDVLR